MIQHQESPRLNYRPTRTNHYNLSKEGLYPNRYEEPLEIYNPRPKLTLIERSVQKLADKELIGRKGTRGTGFKLRVSIDYRGAR